ncbi:MAG: hypothetical protein IPJ71_17120 [Bdellovibrionales bacterium]|nr:hypothetical protein [Bdellovibrionales bacterium]
MFRVISPVLLFVIIFMATYLPASAEEDVNRTLFALAQSLAKHADHGPASPMNWALLTPTNRSEILVNNRKNMLSVLEPREGQVVELALSHPVLLLSEERKPISLEPRVDSIQMAADSSSSLVINKGQLHAVLRWEKEFFIMASSFGPSWADYYSGSNGAGEIVISFGYRLDKVEDPLGISQPLLGIVHETFQGIEDPAQYEAFVAGRIRDIPRLDQIPKFTRDNVRFYLNMGLRDFAADHKDFLMKSMSSLSGARIGSSEKRMKKRFEEGAHQGVGYLLDNRGEQYLLFNIFIEAYDFRDAFGAAFLKALFQTPAPQRIEERFLASGGGYLCTRQLSSSSRVLH